MATIISDVLARRNNAPFAIANNIDLAGNWRTVANIAARDAIESYRLTANQSMAFTQDTSLLYVWDGTAWVEVSFGGGTLGGDASGPVSHAVVERVTGVQDTTIGGTRSIMLQTSNPLYGAYLQLGDPGGSSAYSGIDMNGAIVHMSTDDGHTFLMATDVLAFGGGGTNTMFSLQSGIEIRDDDGLSVANFTLQNPCTLTPDTSISPVFYTGEVADPTTLIPPTGGWTTGSIYNYINGTTSVLYVYTGGAWTPLAGGSFTAGGDLRGTATDQYVRQLTGDVAPNGGRVLWPAATHLDLTQSGGSPPPVATVGWIRSPRYSNDPYLAARNPDDNANVSLLSLNGDQFSVGGSWWSGMVQQSHRMSVECGSLILRVHAEDGNESSGSIDMQTDSVVDPYANSGGIFMSTGSALRGGSGLITIETGGSTGGSEGGSVGPMILRTGQGSAISAPVTGGSMSIDTGMVVGAAGGSSGLATFGSGQVMFGPGLTTSSGASVSCGSASLNENIGSLISNGSSLTMRSGGGGNLSSANNQLSLSNAGILSLIGGSGGNISQVSAFDSLPEATSRGAAVQISCGSGGNVNVACVASADSLGSNLEVTTGAAGNSVNTLYGGTGARSIAGDLPITLSRSGNAGETGSYGTSLSRSGRLYLNFSASGNAVGNIAESEVGGFYLNADSGGDATGITDAISRGLILEMTTGGAGSASATTSAASYGTSLNGIYGNAGSCTAQTAVSTGGGIYWQFGSGGGVAAHTAPAERLESIGGGLVIDFGSGLSIADPATLVRSIGGGMNLYLGHAGLCAQEDAASEGGRFQIITGTSQHNGPNGRGGNFDAICGDGYVGGSFNFLTGSTAQEGGHAGDFIVQLGAYTGSVPVYGQPFGRIRLHIPPSGTAALSNPADERGNFYFSNELVNGSMVFSTNNSGDNRKMILSTLNESYADTVSLCTVNGIASIHFAVANPALQLITNSNDPVLGNLDYFLLSTVPNQYSQIPIPQVSTNLDGYESIILMETGAETRHKTIWSVGEMRADYNVNVTLSTASVNNWQVVGLEYAQAVRATPTLNIVFTGWNYPASVRGPNKRFWNVGSYTVTFNPEDVASFAISRFITPTGLPLICPAGGVVDLIYDTLSSRWRVFLVSPQTTSTVGGGGATYPYGLTTATDLNVQQNDAVWAGLVCCVASGPINRMSAQVAQAATGSVYFAIYDTSLNRLAQSTVGVSTDTIGIKEGVLTSPYTLVSGNYYYLALRCTANGSRFAGASCATGTLTPAPSFVDYNAGLSSFPTTLVLDGRLAQIPWIRASYVP